MLNELLRDRLERKIAATSKLSSSIEPDILANTADAQSSTVSLQADEFDHEPVYKRWAIGVRTLLRLRYLAFKKQALLHNRQELEYDVPLADVQADVLRRVQGDCRPNSFWTFLLGRPVVYLIALALLLFACIGVYRSIAASAEQAIFKQSMPEFSDNVYLLKAQQARSTQSTSTSDKPAAQAPDQMVELQHHIETLKTKILAQFAGLPAIEAALLDLLEGVQHSDTSGEEMVSRSKRFNDLLFDRKIPFYVSVVTETAYCVDLPSERFFSRLFGGEQSSGDICHVHALTAFDVEESRYYANQSDSHLALFTRRLDEQDLHDSFLGLVHIGDDRAQIRLSNIQNASADSLSTVSDGALRSKLMPKGMPDVYGLESLARRLQSRVINSYIDDIERRWWLRIPSLWQELRGNKPDLLALAGERLQARIADVTAFHEVQHLVDQSANIEEPAWFEAAILPFGKRLQNATMRQHVLWELSAFFTHLAYARELQGVLLNDFTSITLNPMLQDQPHFYSIRILLPVLQRQLKGELNTNVVPAKSLADVARAYKALATHSDEIGRVASEAYRVLFGKPLPLLHETRVPPRSMSRMPGS